jgi:hypothetical protein
MVAVLGGPGTPATESGLHLTLATSPGHSLAALLARKAPHRVPASDVPGDEQAWQRNCSNDAVEYPAQNVNGGGRG